MYEKKEMEKKIEQVMRQIGLFGLSTSLLKNQKQATFEIIPTGSNNLIPRVVVTNIVVYFLQTDLQMNAGKDTRHRTNNSQQHHTYTCRPADMELHTAAEFGDTEGASKAVNRKRELLWYQEPNTMNLPLHVAVDKRHKEVALYLIKEYPQGLYALNRSNISPLYLAVVRYPDDWKFVHSLLRIAKSYAFDALQKGNSVVRAAIEHQNQVTGMLKTILKYHPELIEFTDEEGLTPLSYAAYKGHVDIVGYIMRKFPKSINYRNKDNSYPIHKACLGGHLEVLKEIHSKYSASFFALNKQGRTILHLAASERSNDLKPVVSYLLSLPEGKELIKMRDESGRTPLDLATNHEVKDLLEN